VLREKKNSGYVDQEESARAVLGKFSWPVFRGGGAPSKKIAPAPSKTERNREKQASLTIKEHSFHRKAPIKKGAWESPTVSTHRKGACALEKERVDLEGNGLEA